MSDGVNFQIAHPQHSLYSINSTIRKHQPASKLINTCLSTAAQYLNRTKSFNVPQTAMIINKRSINHNNSIQTVEDSPQQDLLINNPDLAKSVPTNINNLYSPSTTIHSLPITPIIHHANRFQPVSSELDFSETNRTSGIVYTLRRSLRKNKERFYNKRSATMKSSNSLNNYEQTISLQSQKSMTPTLLLRHAHMENNLDSSASITTNHHTTMSLLDNCNDDESEKNDQIFPLQPLGLNGRNRILNKSPISLSFVQHQQQSNILPTTTSLHSFTPVTSTNTDRNPIDNTHQQQTINNDDDDEKEKLKNDLMQLKTELQKSKETIARLQKSEEQMRERLAEQAQRQLEKGGKFEDLNQVSRPTELIRSYGALYSQVRIDALDALDNINEMSEADDLKSKLLFSVVVLAFRHAQNHAKDIRNKIKQILQLTNDKNSTVLEETIEKYLRTTIQKYDVGKIIFEVENQLWMTLYDYPNLRSCNELLKYIQSACRIAWGLVNQTLPYYIEFQTTKYDKQIHERFHTSDVESDVIIEYIWPCLIDGRDRTCVAKGVVITDERYLSISKNRKS